MNTPAFQCDPDEHADPDNTGQCIHCGMTIEEQVAHMKFAAAPSPKPFVPVFEPDYAVKPGETIAEVMEHLGYARGWVVVQVGITREELDGIIDEGKPITPVTATELAKVLGLSAEFLLRLDANYRATLARLRGDS